MKFLKTLGIYFFRVDALFPLLYLMTAVRRYVFAKASFLGVPDIGFAS